MCSIEQGAAIGSLDGAFDFSQQLGSLADKCVNHRAQEIPVALDSREKCGVVKCHRRRMLTAFNHTKQLPSSELENVATTPALRQLWVPTNASRHTAGQFRANILPEILIKNLQQLGRFYRLAQILVAPAGKPFLHG